MKLNKLFTGGLAELKPPREPRGIAPSGSRVLGLHRTIQVIGAGPGEAPAGFVGGTTSLSEWYIYWALMQVRGPEGDEGRWAYQESFLGGRHIVGGAVVDFILYEDDYYIGLRIQTYYFHLASPEGSVKQSADLEQKVRLQDGTDILIVDIYEQNFIHDNTGRAAIEQVIKAMQLVEEYNPRTTGDVYP
jgi:hypothetical protein